MWRVLRLLARGAVQLALGLLVFCVSALGLSQLLAVLAEGVQLSSALYSLSTVNSIHRIASDSASLNFVPLFHLPLCSKLQFCLQYRKSSVQH